MKKQITFLFLAAIMSSALVAQTKTASKLGTSLKLSHTDSLMCGKEWHVISVEEWSVVTKPPGEKNATDMLQMGTDMTYTAILFGKKSSGTWSRSGQYIYFVNPASGDKFSYKVIAVDPKSIKVDYRDPDETHSIFVMEAK
ncbi:MAG: hypothetical protein JWP12_2555 [Bacteroidetes bacterium]|nr:hypothetical protein [Bacteroidota bacterium]